VPIYPIFRQKKALLGKSKAINKMGDNIAKIIAKKWSEPFDAIKVV
jgi:hypothetical protein